MTDVHLVLPASVADPTRPSGGNTYDLHLATGLAGLGHRVHQHLVAGPWPERDATALSELATVLDALPSGATVLVDGLVGSVADDVLCPAARRVLALPR